MGKLEGKVCIITGGGTGIGRGTARAFAKEGATLVLAARQLDRLNDSAEEMRGYGVPAHAFQTDVTSEEQVVRAVRDDDGGVREARHPRQQLRGVRRRSKLTRSPWKRG